MRAFGGGDAHGGQLNAKETSGAKAPDPQGHISADPPVAPARRHLKTYQLAFLLAAGTALLYWMSPSLPLSRFVDRVCSPVFDLVSYQPRSFEDSVVAFVRAHLDTATVCAR